MNDYRELSHGQGRFILCSFFSREDTLQERLCIVRVARFGMHLGGSCLLTAQKSVEQGWCTTYKCNSSDIKYTW